MSRYRVLHREILAKFPDAEVSSFIGRQNAFEVEINGQLVFSKLKAGRFPDVSEILEQVEKANGGKGSVKTQL